MALLPLLVRGGAATWLLLLIVLPAPMAARLFLAGPLLVVPLLLNALPDRPLMRRLGTRVLAGWSFVAAGPLAVALSLPPGPSAAALAVAWIGVVGLVGAAALRDGLPRLPALFAPSRAQDLATDGALGLLAGGGAFLLADRLGLAMFGYGPPYTLMGAIHYTFAGFGLLAIVAMLAGQHAALRGGTSALRHWLAAAGLIGGLAITATGLIAGSALVNWAGVLVLAGIGGLAAAWSMVAGGRAIGGLRGLALGGAAVALVAGLSMGVAWASATTFGFEFVGMETMVRTHGVLNALAVVVAALALASGQRGTRP